MSSNRWDGIERPYDEKDVLSLRGSKKIEYTLANDGANKLWDLLHEEDAVRCLGALTGNQAVQQVKAGLKAIYLSGWQVAADANLAGDMYPDQSLYPANSVPAVVKKINKAFQRADQLENVEGEVVHDYYAPIVADAEAGFGGPLNAYELMTGMIDAGAAGVHFEDQLASEKKCGHMGGKVLVPTKQFVKTPINGTKNVILVSSAKGGVGKSTVAVNLAFALQNLGLKIGILDADVYGPSLPKLINLNEKPKSEDGKAMMPLEKYDAQCMAMGFLVDEQTPMIWRGPMVISAIKTMTQSVLWKDRDIIIVDMPPGTGDTQLTFAQQVKVNGAIIVSTPQDLALLDVKRGIQMFDKTGVKILGLIDNMSYFKGDDGKDYKIFGESGVEKTAKEFNKKFLGSLPIHQDLRSSADKGEPLTHSNPDHEVSKLFKNIAEKIKQSFH